jgi:carboxyl-terminal processing protease
MLRGCLKLVFVLMLVACLSSVFYMAGFTTSLMITPRTLPQVSKPAGGSVLSLPTPLPNQSLGGPEFRTFWEAWEIIKGDYFGSLPSDQELTYGAIRGVVATLNDPHTAFLDPQQAKMVDADLSGAFEGIGAYVEQRESQIAIVSVLPGAPAERAGLRASDVILAIDGRSTEGMALFDAITLIRGPRGTTVKLTILHPDAPGPVEVEVTRARINVPTVEARSLADGEIGYIQLFQFNERAPDEFKTALRRLLRDNPRGLILDLRNDPGGYLNVAIDIASQFIGDGAILIERNKDGGEEIDQARSGGLATDPGLPLVVLVNKGSASASEIVAGAIQDRGRGVLIGETTFGKGSVQISRDLSDKSELRVTIAHWYTPNGRQIQGVGLTPDIEVANSATGQDSQLDRAVQYLTR